jgi:EAL domain-containing protein (putative c-di-GMP-specific phosphodiesterase class I)/GGDEF domain-containing protein
VRIVASVTNEGLGIALAGAAEKLEAELITLAAGPGKAEEAVLAALRSHPDLAVVEARPGLIESIRSDAEARGIGLVAACRSGAEAQAAVQAGADEWMLVGADVEEAAARLWSAALKTGRRELPVFTERMAEHLRFEELLYDRYTGFPTLPVMLEPGREILERTGRLTIMYIQFVRYSKLEEIYGWQKLDAVLETTARAVRAFYDRQTSGESVLMVSHTGDDDFIFFTDLRIPLEQAEQRINQMATELETEIRSHLESEHGEDVAGLFEIYVGSTTLFRNPKIRTERMIYRGIREAAHAARGVEGRERTRKVADLKETLRNEMVDIVYHPIVVTNTREVYGYEALARGTHRALRSPEMLFGVAEEANLIWELSRLCRKRALEGMDRNLRPDQFLFLNIDPHDFRDPSFRSLDMDEFGDVIPDRVVLEITERTAITDYPKFQGYLADFRARGFRFAVDDAGSGYAGLGSIANLAPDFIKLDISLISGIDTNYMKQNLVETMVQFANDHGIQVIAEGVEREDEYEAVKRLGVHLTQGFLFHDATTNGPQVRAGDLSTGSPG